MIGIQGEIMRHGVSMRVTAVSFALILAATSFGGGRAEAASRATSGGSGSSADVGQASPLRTSDKPLRDRVSKRPVAHGSMAKASNRKSKGSAPWMADPLTTGPSAQPGTGPAPQVPVAAPPVPAVVTGNPEIERAGGFDGLSMSSGPDTNGEPPDPYLAVGPEHVMQVVNSSFQISDRQGNHSDIMWTQSLAGFIDSFSLPGLSQASWFDPRVVYDSLHGRWILTADGFDCTPVPGESVYGNGYLFFATSDTINPTAGWTGTYLWYADYLVDYSAPGTSTDKFAFGRNFRGSNLRARRGAKACGCSGRSPAPAACGWQCR
jgi:hypothetical protein